MSIAPRKLQQFQAETSLNMRAIARVSGIDYHILENARLGNIELDTAHITHLAHTTPGLNVRNEFMKTRLAHPRKSNTDPRPEIPGTTQLLIPGSEIQVGDWIRYENERHQHSWIKVTHIPQRNPNKQTFPITASAVTVIIYANRQLWVSRPQQPTTQEKPTP